MKPTTSVVIAMIAISGLGGILLAMPAGPMYLAVTADDTPTPTLTTTASPTATGTPAVTLTPTLTATTTSTPTLTATRTAQVYLPYISRIAIPTPTPTPTATPTLTPTPTPLPVRFAGTTDQGKGVSFVVRGDYSAVPEFRIAVIVVCSNGSFAYSGQLRAPEGWRIIDRQFTIRLFIGHSEAGEPLYDVYTGEFNTDFSAVEGTWRKWFVLDELICDNAGTWTAARAPE